MSKGVRGEVDVCAQSEGQQ